MWKKRFIRAALALSLLQTFCSPIRYHEFPDTEGGAFKVVRLKISYKDQANRHSGRVILKYDDIHCVILFLSPLNQLYYKGFVNRESIVVVNTKKKRYWKGGFKDLVRRIWNIDISYHEFLDLILRGEIPVGLSQNRDLSITLDKDEISRVPTKVTILSQESRLLVRVVSKKMRSGRISIETDLGKLERTDINGVVAHD